MNSSHRSSLARIFTAVALTALAWLLPASARAQSEVLIKEVISREVGIFVGADPDSKEVISREVGLFVGADPDYKEVVSREVSLCMVSPEPPPAITGLTFTVTPTGNQVTLNWSSYDQWAVRDVDHYAVYYSATPFTTVAGLTPVRVLPVETFTTTLANLTEWQDHFVAVVAVDALGNQLTAVASRGIYVLMPEVISREVGLFVGADPDLREVVSREVSLVSVDAAPPPAVTGVVVTASPTGSTVNVSWTSYNQWVVRDVKEYRIYWSATPFTSVDGLTPIATVPGETFTWSRTNMPEWQDHFFAVVAVDALGNANSAVTYAGIYILMKEVISREVGLFVGENPALKEVVSREVTILNPSAVVPAAVTGVSSGFTVSTSVKQYGALDLNWNSYDEWAQRDVVRYRVYVADAFFSDVTSMTPLFVANGLQTFTLTGMGPEQIKYVAVVAEDALGQFNPTVYAVSAKSSVPLLGEVGNLTATALPSDLALTWDLGGVGTNLAVFVKEFRLYLDGATQPVVLPGTARAWQMSGLAQGSTHSARLTTVDIFGTESPGLTVSGTTLTSTPGARDTGFTTSGANGEVYAAAGCADGRLVIAGAFTSAGGSTRNRIARLNVDGSLDTAFNPNANGNVWAVFVFGDGSMLAGGEFTSIAGTSRNRLVKLRSDGTLDSAFTCEANGVVNTVVALPSGGFVIAGDFTTINGTTRNRLARIAADGTLDAAFAPSLNARVKAVAVQSDGRIVAGGSFTIVNGVARSGLVRLNTDGTTDATFTATSGDHPRVIVALTDDKLLIGGSFTSIAGVSRQRLIRLNANGTVDSGFNTEANGIVYSFGVQADSRIVVAGDFTNIGGSARNRLVRLRADGSLDSTFTADVNGLIDGCTLLPDGRIVIVGTMTQINGVAASRIGRLANDGTTQSLTITGSTVRWTRGGAAPDATMVAVDHAASIAGPWSRLGMATHSGLGWEFTSSTLPPRGFLRLSGVTQCGLYAGSGQIVEASLSYATPTLFFAQSTSEATEGSAASIEVRLDPPATSATTVALTITGSAVKGTGKDYTTTAPAALEFAAGETRKSLSFTLLDDLSAEPDETIIVTLGAVTGGALVDGTQGQHIITIHDNESAPSFTLQPASALVTVGATGQWTAAATGQPTPTYQWKRQGAAIAGGTTSTLTIPAMTTTRAGSYTVTATNRISAVTASFEVGVVDTSVRRYTLVAGTQTSFSPVCAGNGLTYAWVRAEAPQTVVATTKALAFKPLTIGDTGTWRCRVSAPGTTTLEAPIQITVFDGKPQPGIGIASPVTLPTAMASELFAFDARAQWFSPDTRLTPTSFRATLPPGLSINTSTGMIQGRADGARIVKGIITPYAISVTATNAKGSTTLTGTMLVVPLPADITGTWLARIPRHPTINANCGGRVSISVSTSGVVSATVQNGAQRFIASQRLDTQASSVLGTVLLTLTKSGPPLNLHLTLSGGRLTGTLENGIDTVVLDGWRNPWSTTMPAPLRGYHTFLIDPGSSISPGDQMRPQGFGFGSFTIGAAGTLTLSARLADGTSCTSASSISDRGEILFQSPLYADQGSIEGVLAVTLGVGYQVVTGPVTWNRPALAGRLSAVTFPPISLTVQGSSYQAPAIGRVFLDMPEPLTGVAENAQLTFTEGSLASAFDALLLIKHGNIAAFQPFTTGRSSTLSLVPSTGNFSGTLTVTDPNPAAANAMTKRKATFYGIIVREAAGVKGGGWFLLPQLPVPPKNLTTSPQSAGRVVLRPQ